MVKGSENFTRSPDFCQQDLRLTITVSSSKLKVQLYAYGFGIQILVIIQMQIFMRSLATEEKY